MNLYRGRYASFGPTVAVRAKTAFGAFAASFLVLSLADALTTMIAVAAGASELNPVISHTLMLSPSAFIILKCVGCIAVIYTGAKIAERRNCYRLSATVMGALAMVMLAVVVNNLYQLSKIV